ncbi:MAG TPA: hypothetical protein VEY92_00080 [Pseudoxanthomonas sp.]|nr:hypothetical protein [Pseudoxanthomonas sp.]
MSGWTTEAISVTRPPLARTRTGSDRVGKEKLGGAPFHETPLLLPVIAAVVPPALAGIVVVAGAKSRKSTVEFGVRLVDDAPVPIPKNRNLLMFTLKFSGAPTVSVLPGLVAVAVSVCEAAQTRTGEKAISPVSAMRPQREAIDPHSEKMGGRGFIII